MIQRIVTKTVRQGQKVLIIKENKEINQRVNDKQIKNENYKRQTRVSQSFPHQHLGVYHFSTSFTRKQQQQEQQKEQHNQINNTINRSYITSNNVQTKTTNVKMVKPKRFGMTKNTMQKPTPATNLNRMGTAQKYKIKEKKDKKEYTKEEIEQYKLEKREAKRMRKKKHAEAKQKAKAKETANQQKKKFKTDQLFEKYFINDDTSKTTQLVMANLETSLGSEAKSINMLEHTNYLEALYHNVNERSKEVAVTAEVFNLSGWSQPTTTNDYLHESNFQYHSFLTRHDLEQELKVAQMDTMNEEFNENSSIDFEFEFMENQMTHIPNTNYWMQTQTREF